VLSPFPYSSKRRCSGPRLQLSETQQEEEATDELLSKLAEGGVNEAALTASGGDEE